MRIEFIQDYDISKLSPADYNPRKLQEDKFLKLQESIKKFGIIKPLIVNGDNSVLTAGHQRTRAIKALGIKTAPVIKICGINIQDEIKFNLFHNSIETNKTKVTITNCPKKSGYYIISSENIEFSKNLNATIVKEIGRLILKYGEWGSIVSDQNGNVILNSDYAVAAKLLKTDVICYVIENEKCVELKKYLAIEYGEYNYDSLGIKSYNQLYCQMSRLGNIKRENKSTLYENYVIKDLTKDLRILDFGAGKCAYVNLLRKNGYNILAYEPNFQNGKRNINIAAVIKMLQEIQKDISKNGLFDIVVLDSVLNSVVNSEVENYVIATCNGFLKKGGALYVGTRNLGAVRSKEKMLSSNSLTREIQFLDKENFTATFRDGCWTMQHFHDKDTLRTLLSKYFEDVELYGVKTGSNIYAIAKSPKNLDKEFVKKSLEFELNMEYPNNFHHNKHKQLVEIILKKLEDR